MTKPEKAGLEHANPSPSERIAVYRPSPRPNPVVPTLITRSGVTRYIWGDQDSGLVADWIYASTELIHLLMFGLAPGGSFRHSKEFRTVFAADEVLCVLSGSLMAANPETGEVVTAETGDFLFFRRDTWHHVFARGPEPLRVLEFFSPPPSAGTSGAYSRTRPFLEESTYRRDQDLGSETGRNLPEDSCFTVIRSPDLTWRREGDLSLGLVASTKHLTVCLANVDSGVMTQPREHGGDALVFGLAGPLMVRTQHETQVSTFELDRHDAVYVPKGATYEILNFGDQTTALIGVAPSYLP